MQVDFLRPLSCFAEKNCKKFDFSRINIHLFANHPIDFGIGFGEAAENYFFYGSRNVAQNCFKGNLCRLFFGEMVNSGADAGKCDRFAVVFFCQSQ